MAHRELDLREGCAIEDMLNAKMSVTKIAAEIGRHRSSNYLEVKRNSFAEQTVILNRRLRRECAEDCRWTACETTGATCVQAIFHLQAYHG